MSIETVENNVEQIKQVAPTVERIGAEFDQARAAQREAETFLLAGVVETVRPALRALSGRIRKSRSFIVDGVGGETVTYHEARGVYVSDDAPGKPATKVARLDDTSGPYSGFDLVLLSDGTFAEQRYTGSWTRWVGQTDEWDSTLTPVTIDQVIDGWDVEEVIATIAARLTSYAEGKATARADQARERAAKLSAIVALLQ